MFNIVFPSYTGQKYYDIHYRYLLNIFKYLGCSIKLEERTGLVVTINSESFLFDYSDDCNLVPDCVLRIFKFHCTSPKDNIIPFPPVSFLDWDEYYRLEREIQYTGKGDKISCRQRLYGNAVIRRMSTQSRLRDSIGDGVLINEIPQLNYWREIDTLAFAVMVPGFSENILDRGASQYLGLGCPIITPTINEILPFNKKYLEGEHYICCNGVDVLAGEKAYFYKNLVNRQSLVKVGKNAKELFQQTSTPEAIGKWIQQHL